MNELYIYIYIYIRDGDRAETEMRVTHFFLIGKIKNKTTTAIFLFFIEDNLIA